MPNGIPLKRKPACTLMAAADYGSQRANTIGRSRKNSDKAKIKLVARTPL